MASISNPQSLCIQIKFKSKGASLLHQIKAKSTFLCEFHDDSSTKEAPFLAKMIHAPFPRPNYVSSSYFWIKTVFLMLTWDKMRLNMIMRTYMNLTLPLVFMFMILGHVSDLIMPLMLCITQFNLQVWIFMHEMLA